MAMLMMMRRGGYTNKDAVDNLIHYVTRTRRNEDRGDELVAWGGMGVGCYGGPELAITQIRYVQDCYGIEARGGRRMFHEVLCIRDEEFGWLAHSYGAAYQIGMGCAGYYYSMGFQVVFAVHHPKHKQPDSSIANKWVHIHFAVNTINFRDGRKWHTSFRENYARERAFNDIMGDLCGLGRRHLYLPVHKQACGWAGTAG